MLVEPRKLDGLLLIETTSAPAQVAALVAGYEAGKTMKELAAEFGINRNTVKAHLRRSEAALRRLGLDAEQAR